MKRASSSLVWALLCCWAMAMALERASSQEEVYSPTDIYLIKCGGQGNVTIDSRVWQGDNELSSLISSSSPQASIAASISYSSLPLLSTSRIFTQKATYTFSVTPGRHWLRLHFYPFPYQNFNPSAATFSVTAAQFTLLSNFKPTANTITSSPTSYDGNTSYVFKEYDVNVTVSPLQITFIPSGSNSSYAFINAIELISLPFQLISDDTSPLGVNSPTPIGIPSMALETMYRVNVGGPLVTPSNDSAGLYRTWLPGENFLLLTADVHEFNSSVSSIKYPLVSRMVFAPPIVYSTALHIVYPDATKSKGLNISWVFPVVADYRYAIRLHFCELQYTTGGKRVFNVYLQNQTAYANLDLGQLAGEYVPYYVDFSLIVERDASIWIQAGPPPNSGSSTFNEAFMNGIEIWKLNNSESSLDGSGDGGSSAHQSGSKAGAAPIVGGVVGSVVALGLLMMAVCCFCRQRAKVVKQPTSAWIPLPLHGGHSISVVSKTTMVSGAGSYASSAPSSMGRIFTFSEILEATHTFDETRVIGVGGFGKVYQGELDDGTKVAVKRGNPRSEQGLMEFQTEIEMLSKLRHRHLVPLIGYCKENQEMVLVYEFMANGPLRSHLYGSNLPPLSWRQRLEICIGAARGLHYLHTGATRSIIHRDVKTTNILLDENLVAKVSDFGLSKTGPTLDQTHVSTAVKGSFGYLDPEYFRRQQLTEKSDVYSFGVVLMEVLCARPAINPTLPRDQVNIAEWAIHWQSRGMLDQIIDPHLAGTISMESLAKFGETAEKCLAEDGISRPAIGQVLWNLEYALQLQEMLAPHNVDDESEDRILELPILQPVQEQWEESTTVNHSFVESEDEPENATMSAVFSRMVRPNGS